MNKQEELLEEPKPKKSATEKNKVKELSQQYKNGELSRIDVLMAIRDLLINFN